MEHQCKCGSFDMFTETKGNNVGLYCSMCGKWQKWLNKDEVRLFEHNQVTKKKNLSNKDANEKKDVEKILYYGIGRSGLKNEENILYRALRSYLSTLE